MGLSAKQLKASLDALAKAEPRIAEAIRIAGYPEARSREPGYETLLRTIVGQQVSVKAAAAIWNKLEAGLGDLSNPENMVGRGPEELRAFGLSRQKHGYATSLAQLVVDGELPLDTLPKEDEAAIELLTRVKGIGRWSAEIYLLFAEGRADVWPAGDLAVQVQVGRMMGLDARPSEKKIRNMAEAWRPHRGAMAVFSWHCYNIQAL